MKTRFSSIASMTTTPLVQALFLQPFVVELIDGILPYERFVYFIRQDSLYLSAYGRALSLTAGKLTNLEDISCALNFASKALTLVNALHSRYLKHYQAVPDKQKNPACFAYCAHILERASLGSPAESFAALLPRASLFRELGNHIRSLADTDNPWFSWVESFSNDDFSLLVDNAATLTDKLASEASDDDRQNMLEAYIASSRYEFALVEDAYQLREWPA